MEHYEVLVSSILSYQFPVITFFSTIKTISHSKKDSKSFIVDDNTFISVVSLSAKINPT